MLSVARGLVKTAGTVSLDVFCSLGALAEEGRGLAMTLEMTEVGICFHAGYIPPPDMFN